jgi:predicted DNA-binding protein
VERSTSIRLNASTKDRLESLGKKGQTFDEVLRELLNKVQAASQ